MPDRKVKKKAARKKSPTPKPKKKAAKRATRSKKAPKKLAKKSPSKKTSASAKKTVRGKSTKKKRKVSRKKVLNSASYAEAETKAMEYAKDPEKLKGLFQEAAETSKGAPKIAFGDTWAYLQAMIRLIRAYANGEYRDIPWKSLVMIVVAVIYFVSPLDAIPDWIPVAGFLDDALVVSLALRQVKDDLDAFMEWEVSGR